MSSKKSKTPAKKAPAPKAPVKTATPKKAPAANTPFNGYECGECGAKISKAELMPHARNHKVEGLKKQKGKNKTTPVIPFTLYIDGQEKQKVEI